MEKLVSLIPRPKVHLTRFYGVLASHYKYRKDIVPKTTPDRPPNPPQPLLEEGTPSDSAESLLAPPAPIESRRSKRYSWARLLKRVFHIDISKCSKCGGNTKIISAIDEPDVIVKILSHLKLPTRPPELAPARDPPVAFTRGPSSGTHNVEMEPEQANFLPESFQGFPQNLD